MKVVKKIFRGFVAGAKALAIGLVVGLVGVNLILPINKRMQQTFPNKTYALFLLGTTPQGLQPVSKPTPVRDVYQNGNLLCFTNIITDSHNCINYPMYHLLEMKIK